MKKKIQAKTENSKKITRKMLKPLKNVYSLKTFHFQKIFNNKGFFFCNNMTSKNQQI